MTNDEVLADFGVELSNSVNDPSVSAHGNDQNLLLKPWLIAVSKCLVDISKCLVSVYRCLVGLS